MEGQFILAAALPLSISLLITPWVIKIAHRLGAIDKPNARKIHTTPTARLGGLAVFASFFLSLAVLVAIYPDSSPLFSINPLKMLLLIASFCTVLILGTLDDLYTLKPIPKLFIQWIAATLIYFAGVRISGITHPFSSGLLELGVIDYPATILWILGITNAINLIDGLDGLASGVSIIAALTIFSISLLTGELATATSVLILTGALIGFLRYNFNPARIFLGDSGSLFIGFALAVFSIESSTKGSTAIAILAPILALGLPIMDTIIAMARRFLRSIVASGENSSSGSPWKVLTSIFVPDKEHIHHRLIARGLSHRNTVLLLYLVSCIFGIGAFSVTVTNSLGASIILLIVAIGTSFGVNQLGYREMAILRNGSLLPIYRKPLVQRRSFQMTFDFLFIIAAFSIATMFHSGTSTPDRSMNFMLVVACLIQSFMFLVAGVYRTTIQHIGVGDLLRNTKAVILSVIWLAIILAIFPETRMYVNIGVLLVDFYLLLTFVIGSRLSYQVLYYVFRRNYKANGKKVLIYGANTDGAIILQRILLDEESELVPIGFLDDAPELEGKTLNGYPIFGGHWKLPKLLRQHDITDIVISGKIMMTEVFERLKRSAREHDITLRKFSFAFEDLSLEPERRSPIVSSTGGIMPNVIPSPGGALSHQAPME